jgi:flagellar protein FlbD
MIELTKYNDQVFLLNCDLIETVEETPDTVITLLNGKKLIVKENRTEIYERICDYRKKTLYRFNAYENENNEI